MTVYFYDYTENNPSDIRITYEPIPTAYYKDCTELSQIYEVNARDCQNFMIEHPGSTGNDVLNMVAKNNILERELLP